MVYLYSITHPRNQLFGSSSIFQQVRRVLPSGVVNGGRGGGGEIRDPSETTFFPLSLVW